CSSLFFTSAKAGTAAIACSTMVKPLFFLIIFYFLNVKNERYDATIVKTIVLYLNKLSRRDLVQQWLKNIGQTRVFASLVHLVKFV
ncbi:MAG: hypothetical protein U9N53_07875, partial [Bacteroidota bacterium]|nr:hypothetical protein [Bacteroidota bacterium]